MSLFRKLLLIVSTSLVVACDQSGQATSPLATSFDLTAELDALISVPDRAPTEISGLQMILIKNGDIVFEHAAGLARRSPAVEVDMTTKHKVRIASISKLVLTMAFMSLVDDGVVDIDADISDYLGFSLRNPHFPDSKITTRQLLAHISSIRDGSYYFLGPDEDFKDFFVPGAGVNSADHFDNGEHFANGQNQGPGEYFTYSNLNFGILAGIIEKVTGKRLDLFVKEQLFDPLGLSSSFGVCTLYGDNFSSLATLYRRGDGGETWDVSGPWRVQVDGDPIGCYYGSERYARGEIPDLSPLEHYQLGKNPTMFSPQGGVRASANDLAILMQVLLQDGEYNGHQIMSSASVAQMRTPVWQYDDQLSNGQTGGEALPDDVAAMGMMTAYGLSTHIVDLKDWGLSEHSRIFYGHLGSAYGLQGQFWFDPVAKNGIVAFITGVGDDPAKARSTIPLNAIEEVVLRLGLRGLD